MFNPLLKSLGTYSVCVRRGAGVDIYRHAKKEKEKAISSFLRFWHRLSNRRFKMSKMSRSNRVYTSLLIKSLPDNLTYYCYYSQPNLCIPFPTFDFLLSDIITQSQGYRWLSSDISAQPDAHLFGPTRETGTHEPYTDTLINRRGRERECVDLSGCNDSSGDSCMCICIFTGDISGPGGWHTYAVWLQFTESPGVHGSAPKWHREAAEI